MGKKRKQKFDPDQLDSVIEGPKEIELTDGNKVTLRPFTFGSLTLCKKLGLTMFSGEGDDEDDESPDLDGVEDQDEDLDDESLFQMQTFFWMQTQPVNEVLGAVRSENWKDRVEEFGFVLPVHEMGSMMKEINRISKMTADAAVDIIPKDDEEEDKPGE